MFITNVPMAAVTHGKYPKWVGDKNTILIQIQDPDYSPMAKFANAKKRSRFVRVYQYRFEDDVRGPNVITDDDANSIVGALNFAKQHGYNVLVHCHAGLCRSGAVTEVGVMLGFEDVNGNPRIPNTLVKQKLRVAAGLIHSWEVVNVDSLWG